MIIIEIGDWIQTLFEWLKCDGTSIPVKVAAKPKSRFNGNEN